MKRRVFIAAGLVVLGIISPIIQGCTRTSGKSLASAKQDRVPSGNTSTSPSDAAGSETSESAPAPGKRRTTNTQIYVDVSASMYGLTPGMPIEQSRSPKSYRKVLLNLIDAIGPNTHIEIRTFTAEKDNLGLRKVYDGSPSGREDVFSIIKHDVFPDTYKELLNAVSPGSELPKSDKNGKMHPPQVPQGTSLQGVLKQIRVTCQQHPKRDLRVVIVTDGGICSDENDQDEIDESTKKATEIATHCPNFKGIIVLPVVNQDNLRTILEQKILRDISGKVLVASQEEADQKIRTFATF